MSRLLNYKAAERSPIPAWICQVLDGGAPMSSASVGEKVHALALAANSRTRGEDFIRMQTCEHLRRMSKTGIVTKMDGLWALETEKIKSD